MTKISTHNTLELHTILGHKIPLPGGTSELGMSDCKCQADLMSDYKCQVDHMPDCKHQADLMWYCSSSLDASIVGYI